MKYFFDNCLSPYLAEAIRALRQAQEEHYEVLHLRDKFPQNVADPVWLRALGDEGDWVIVSGDPRITRNPTNRKAWLESGVTAFFCAKGWGNQTLWEHSSRFVKWWPRILAKSRKVKAGTGFLVPWKGDEFDELRPS